MISVSDNAIGEFKRVLGSDENKGMGIKIKAHVAQSSCCSCGPGQSYEMGLVDKGEPGDQKLDFGGVDIYMDDASLELMGGYEIDFLDGQGFVVKDNSEPSCGCGGHDYGDHGHGHGGSCCG